MKSGLSMLIGITALGLSLTSQASITLVTSGAALGGNDMIDWSSIGSNGDTISNPFSANSVGGLGMSISQIGGDFQRIDQSSGWSGNFAAGDKLLWTGGGGPLTIMFANPISGIGTQIQANFFGAFGAEIDAYDSLDNLLGSVNDDGSSNSFGDNSAIYIGASSSSADISKVVISLSYAASQPGDFAIKTADLFTDGRSNPATPEPGSMAIVVGMGISGAGLLARRRK